MTKDEEFEYVNSSQSLDGADAFVLKVRAGITSKVEIANSVGSSGWFNENVGWTRNDSVAPDHPRVGIICDPNLQQLGLSFLEKCLPDGRGVRLNMDGSFKGFLD